MRRLVLGDGLLGSELVKQTGWDYISRKKDMMDLKDIVYFIKDVERYDVIINCIGHTDTYDENKEIHWDVNYKFVSDLVSACSDKKLVHISTDYIYSNSKSNVSENDVPVHCENWYGYTKLLGDAHVQLKSKDYLLIRCSHKPEPFPYEKAFINQSGNFDYVSVISNLIIKLIEKGLDGIYNVGTELKTMYDLAKLTKNDVEPTEELFNKTMPKNISMNLDKLKDLENDR